MEDHPFSQGRLPNHFKPRLDLSDERVGLVQIIVPAIELGKKPRVDPNADLVSRDA